MKVIEIRDTFGVDSLKLVERPDLMPGPGQVVLKMKAFSINYRDAAILVNRPDIQHTCLDRWGAS